MVKSSYPIYYSFRLSPFQGSATMHELQVTPLLMHKGSKSRHQKRLKRASQSFDECAEEFSSHVGLPRHHKHRAYRQRSNPNILDLIPPPPPLYAPPSLQPRHEADPCSSKRSSQPHRPGLRSHHIMERRDSDSSDYFTQVKTGPQKRQESFYKFPLSALFITPQQWLDGGFFVYHIYRYIMHWLRKVKSTILKMHFEIENLTICF